ncbi:uncharacterized protein LOC129938939 [Eupeodes corollae]|uniref:uncharacterized protein LOC129938939 n=1 Tax=Eupeodes corollae TaxID=290404 RepID=UPI0024913D6F|nr:uncharacterized protein LOC129938939 [Eupeodes corollae]
MTQEVKPLDHQKHRMFVNWAEQQLEHDSGFHRKIIFSNEAHFRLNGFVNKQDNTVTRRPSQPTSTSTYPPATITRSNDKLQINFPYIRNRPKENQIEQSECKDKELKIPAHCQSLKSDSSDTTSASSLADRETFIPANKRNTLDEQSSDDHHSGCVFNQSHHRSRQMKIMPSQSTSNDHTKNTSQTMITDDSKRIRSPSWQWFQRKNWHQPLPLLSSPSPSSLSSPLLSSTLTSSSSLTTTSLLSPSPTNGFSYLPENSISDGSPNSVSDPLCLSRGETAEQLKPDTDTTERTMTMTRVVGAPPEESQQHLSSWQPLLQFSFNALALATPTTSSSSPTPVSAPSPCCPAPLPLPLGFPKPSHSKSPPTPNTPGQATATATTEEDNFVSKRKHSSLCYNQSSSSNNTQSKSSNNNDYNNNNNSAENLFTDKNPPTKEHKTIAERLRNFHRSQDLVTLRPPLDSPGISNQPLSQAYLNNNNNSSCVSPPLKPLTSAADISFSRSSDNNLVYRSHSKSPQQIKSSVEEEEACWKSDDHCFNLSVNNCALTCPSTACGADRSTKHLSHKPLSNGENSVSLNPSTSPPPFISSIDCNQHSPSSLDRLKVVASSSLSLEKYSDLVAPAEVVAADEPKRKRALPTATSAAELAAPSAEAEELYRICLSEVRPTFWW